MEFKSAVVLYSLMDSGLNTKKAGNRVKTILRGRGQKKAWIKRDVKKRGYFGRVSQASSRSLTPRWWRLLCSSQRAQPFVSLWSWIRFAAAAPDPYVGGEALGKNLVLKRVEEEPWASLSCKTLWALKQQWTFTFLLFFLFIRYFIDIFLP